MALDPVVNFFQTEIATLPVASGGTSIVISTGDGAKLPDPAVDGAFNLTIYNESDPFASPEIVRVTAITGDTLTVTRAQEGTSATTKTAGSDWYVELTPTAKTIQDIDTAKLNVADVVNNLTSTDTDKALSANQGKVLQDNKEPADATILKQADIVNNLTSTATTAPLSANQGKVLQDSKLNLSGGTMTGDLTIGKDNPVLQLNDTNGSVRRASIGFGTDGGNWSIDVDDNLTLKNASVGSPITTGSHIILGRLAGDMALGTNGVERLRITSAGNVGIGTTTPTAKLTVLGANEISTFFVAGNSGANGVVFDRVGNNQPFNIFGFNNGDIRVSNMNKIAIPGSGVTNINIDSSGDFTTSTSDKRKKTHISDFSNGLNIVNQITPVKYYWKDDTNQNSVLGFYAQDVYNILPELVYKNPKTTLDIETQEIIAVLDEHGFPDYSWGMNQDGLIAVMWSAIQELKTEIDSLKNLIK